MQPGAVVGGSAGIWLAIAEQPASHGATVIIVSSNTERIQNAIASINGGAQGHVVDVLDEAVVETLFTKLGAFRPSSSSHRCASTECGNAIKEAATTTAKGATWC